MKIFTMKRTRLVVFNLVIFGILAGSCHGLRRHERHRRVSGPDPNPAVDSNGRILKDEQRENKHKPKFERCDDYEPEVLEEEPVGKKLILLFVSRQYLTLPYNDIFVY